MSLKVFVSHSTWPWPDQSPEEKIEQELHAQFRDRVVQGLKDNPNIDVTVDSEMPPDRLWRQFLFEGMADCRAAVVLLNKRALREECRWVDTEVTIFSYRARVEGDAFRLIIVPYGGVQPADIARKSSWSPVATSEFQMRLRDGSDPLQPEVFEPLMQNILETLRGLPDRESGGGWLVSRICALLPKEDHVLATFARQLEIPAIPKLSERALRRRVARYMYELGPRCLKDFQDHEEWEIGFEGLRELLGLLGTFWVETSATVPLVAHRDGSRTQRLFAMNGSEIKYTPNVYLRQICKKTPWPLVTITLGRGELEQVTKQLLVEFGWQMKEDSSLDDASSPDDKIRELNEFLEDSECPPVFVTFLAPGGGGNDLLRVTNSIREQLPFLNFIVCTQTEPGQQMTLHEDFHVLPHPFTLAEEVSHRRAYRTASAHIRPSDE